MLSVLKNSESRLALAHGEKLLYLISCDPIAAVIDNKLVELVSIDKRAGAVNAAFFRRSPHIAPVLKEHLHKHGKQSIKRNHDITTLKDMEKHKNFSKDP